MARLEERQMPSSPKTANDTAAAAATNGDIVHRTRQHMTATKTTTTVVTPGGGTVSKTTEARRTEVTTVEIGGIERTATIEEEESAVETIDGTGRSSDAVRLGFGGGGDSAGGAAASGERRFVTLPTHDSVRGRWGPERRAFAERSSIPRYDETPEQAAEHRRLEARIVDARAAAKKSGGGGGGGGRKKKGGFGRSAGGSRAAAASSTASSHASSANSEASSASSAAASSPAASQSPPPSAAAAAGGADVPPNPVPSTSWTPISAAKFSVRCGPNYKKLGRKAPSRESLYEPVAVRCYRSDRRTVNVADVLPPPLNEAFGGDGGGGGGGGEAELPDLSSGGGAAGTEATNKFVPDLLIFHIQLPYEEPKMFKTKDDGKGGEVIYYMKPSRRFVDELNSSRPLSPAARHFVNWCQTCDSDLSVRSQFKCMALVRNLSHHNLSWLGPYNGKPVLITESGRARRGTTPEGVRFLEMSANVHRWAFLAKKGFVSLIPKFRDMRIDVGFTIEASADADMPECILGAVGMNYIDESTFGKIEGGMQAGCEGAGNEIVGKSGSGGTSPSSQGGGGASGRSSGRKK